MSINFHMNYVGTTLLVAFVISGCQSPSKKWAMASKERTNSKYKMQADPEDRAAGPPKSGTNAERMVTLPGSKDEMLVRNSAQSKDALRIADLIEKGDRSRKSGQYEDARLSYNSALTIAPDNPDVNHRLAIIADKQQQFSVADQCYQAALRVRPKDLNILSDLGYSYSLRGNAKQAEQTLKQALAIDATHRGAMANLGAIYVQQNRYPEAQVMFRKGFTTEAEAQQNIAKLFSGTSTAAVADSGRGNASATAIMASTPPEKGLDLSQLSLEQLQLEMARREQSGKPGRKRESSWDEADPQTERVELLQANLQRTFNSDRERASGKSRTEIPDGQATPQIVQVRGQTNGDATDTVHPDSRFTPARRLATRVGMNAGPGNLFPILSVENAGIDSFCPATPVKSALTAGTANWRDNLQNSMSWDSDTQNADSSNSDFSSTGRSQLGSEQTVTGRTEPVGANRSETSSFAGLRNGNESSRPYSGDWPKSNNIPSRKRQNTSANGPFTEGFDNSSVSLSDGAVTRSPRFANGASTNLPVKSPAQWPDAPR